MLFSSLIKDGYDESAYLEAVPQLHGPLRFKYRPIPTEDASEFFEQSQKLKAREADRKTAKLIKDRLIEWDLKEKGEHVPITQANVLRLRRRLFQRLGSVILGIEACDLDPTWPEEEQDEFVALKSGAEPGQTFGAAREAADAKNS